MDAHTVARALASKTRLRLLLALGEDGATVTQAAELAGVSPATASVGLDELRRAGLVDEAWRGREHLYRVRRQRLTFVLGEPPVPAELVEVPLVNGAREG